MKPLSDFISKYAVFIRETFLFYFKIIPGKIFTV